MKWETYGLYQRVNKPNSIGQLKPSWEYIEDIEVVVSQKLYTQVNGEVVCRKYEPTAITKHHSLDHDGVYEIRNSKHEYKIESFNTAHSRYSQLLLKEIV